MGATLLGCAGSPRTEGRPSTPATSQPDVPSAPATAERRAHSVFQPMSVDSNRRVVRESSSTGFDFQSHGPLEFLDFLVETRASTDSPVSLDGIHVGWIRESDLPELAAKLDSTEPCRGVMLVTSSFIAHQPSTVGHEAAWLMLGYRSEQNATGYGGYPPSLLSTRGMHTTAIADARAWWDEYRSSR